MTAATKLKDVCSLEEKLWQLRHHIKKQRHPYTPLPTKICIVKAMVFPVVMYGYESWTTKKAEHWRIEAFELWCWRWLLDIKEIKPVNPKGNQSWICTGRTDAKAPYFGHLMQRADSLENTLMEGRRRRGWQRMRWLDGITNSMDMILANSKR